MRRFDRKGRADIEDGDLRQVIVPCCSRLLCVGHEPVLCLSAGTPERGDSHGIAQPEQIGLHGARPMRWGSAAMEPASDVTGSSAFRTC
jgi:hypothetical protein